MTRGAQRFHDFMSRAFTPVRHVPDEHVDAACGRVLDDLRDGVDVGSTHIGGDLLLASPQGTWLRPATVFATVVVAAAIGTVIVWSRGDSALYRVVDGTVQAGGTIQANGGGAQLMLVDGSRVEMRSQSELSLERADDGLRIRLSKGGIIVNAAEQRTGHLYVQTKDVTVSVVGTVFLVNAAEDGSRVAVIEGEVRVQHGVTAKTLLPGEQVATNPAMAARPVRDAIAWSRNAAALVTLLQQSAVVPPALAPQNPIEPRERFEVVSIRPRPAARGGGRGDVVMPSGFPPACGAGFTIDPRRFLATNITVYEIITLAYDKYCVFAEEVPEAAGLTGGPEWIRSERFDVEALRTDERLDYTTRSSGTGRFQYNEFTVGPRLRSMLRTLLTERFNLVLRHDLREMQVYELSLASGGPKLTPSKEGEGILSYVGGGGLYEAIKNSINPRPEYSGLIVGAISARRASMAHLSSQLARMTGRPVFDRTGIDGEFTYEFFFAPAQFRAWRRNPNETRPILPNPSLFAVLEQELGLRLEATRGPVEVLAIEQVERPSEN